jgi:hypothetical protein
MRATAQRFSKDIRIKGSSVRAHLLADRKYKSDVDAACKALRRGPKVSDQGRAKPSVAATRRVPVISQRDQANGAADENNDDKPGKRESDIQTLLEILWVDLDEANALAATLHGLDEDQSSVLRERADELRGAADLLDGIPKAGRA